MVKAFAARLRRIADRLDPPAKPLLAKSLYKGIHLWNSHPTNSGTITATWERPIGPHCTDGTRRAWRFTSSDFDSDFD